MDIHSPKVTCHSSMSFEECTESTSVSPSSLVSVIVSPTILSYDLKVSNYLRNSNSSCMMSSYLTSGLFVSLPGFQCVPVSGVPLVLWDSLKHPRPTKTGTVRPEDSQRDTSETRLASGSRVVSVLMVARETSVLAWLTPERQTKLMYGSTLTSKTNWSTSLSRVLTFGRLDLRTNSDRGTHWNPFSEFRRPRLEVEIVCPSLPTPTLFVVKG